LCCINSMPKHDAHIANVEKLQLLHVGIYARRPHIRKNSAGRSSAPWHVSWISTGYPFRLTGANEPMIEKHILKCQKNWNKNFACTSWHIMFVHKFSEEKNIFYVLYKKTNLCMNISLFTGHIFIFFTDAT
jgi:hypothetical protein